MHIWGSSDVCWAFIGEALVVYCVGCFVSAEGRSSLGISIEDSLRVCSGLGGLFWYLFGGF